jgi:hypothetical protein
MVRLDESPYASGKNSNSIKWYSRALMQAAKTAILLNGFAASDQKILGSGNAKTPHCDRPNLPGNPIYG